jgi:hypothetical protein
MMAIAKLTALEQRNIANSDGADVASSVNQLIDVLEDSNFDTLAQAVASTTFDIAGGQTIYLDERTTGNGGGAHWKTIVAGTTPGVDLPNTFDIVACTGVPTLAVVLIPNGAVWSDQIGIPTDGTDAAPAHDAAVALAVSKSLGIVRFTAGEYTYLTAPSPHTRAISLIGPTPPSTAINSDSIKQTAFLVHAYDGDFLTFNGASGLGITGSGGEIRNFAILNKFGAPASANGRAIVIDGVTADQRSTWLRLVDLEINSYASATYGEFSWGIDADGSTVTTANGAIRDVFINRVRIASGVGATGAVRLYNVLNVFMSALFLNLSKGDLLITGPDASNKSAGIYATNVVAGVVTADQAFNVNISGGRAVSIVTTANTGADVQLEFTSINESLSLAGNANIKAYINSDAKYVTRLNNAEVEVFGRDDNAGDSTNSTAIIVGNTGANQGGGRIQYTNGDPSTGQQNLSYRLAARNVADTGIANLARIDFNQVTGTDSAQIDLFSGSTRKMRIFQEGVNSGEFLGNWNPIGDKIFDLGNSANHWEAVFCQRVLINNTQVVGAQQPTVSGPVGGATQDNEARAAIDLILARLKSHGLIAP